MLRELFVCNMLVFARNECYSISKQTGAELPLRGPPPEGLFLWVLHLYTAYGIMKI
jgi:hypothetical protein